MIGQVIWKWEGEAFGNTAAQEFTATQVNLRFPGQYYDAETNLHYNHFRYYDSTLGRYITSDPIGLKGGLNTFQYTEQNSLSYIDPTGLIWAPATEALVDIACYAMEAMFDEKSGEWIKESYDIFYEDIDTVTRNVSKRLAICVSQFQRDQDECKYQACIKAVYEYEKMMLERVNNNLNIRLAGNLWNEFPGCPPYSSSVMKPSPPKGPPNE